MHNKENIKITGVTEHRIYDKQGNLIASFEDNNVVVSQAKVLMGQLLAGASTDKITKIGFGTNGAAATEADVALTGSTVKNIDSYATDETGLTFYWSLDYSEGNGLSIQERGLITQASMLFARKAHPAVAKTADIRIEGSWRINI